MPTNFDAAVVEWQALLGSEYVLLGDAVLNAFGQDSSGVIRKIPAALRIIDAALLPKVMRIAHQYCVPVYPVSTGRNWGQLRLRAYTLRHAAIAAHEATLTSPGETGRCSAGMIGRLVVFQARDDRLSHESHFQ